MKKPSRSLRLLMAALTACTATACQKHDDPHSITDAMPRAAKAQREAARRMAQEPAPALHGIGLYTGPERMPAFAKGLTIVGYNYTDTAITSFSVNGAGGGNIEVSSRDYSYGGGTCCAPMPQGTPLPIPVDIKWQRDGIGQRRWCEQKVPLTGPIPKDAGYVEVHFYQDGTIQAAITDYPTRPRVLMDRYSPALRKPDGNVDNDSLHSTCGME